MAIIKKKKIKIPIYTGFFYIFLFENREEILKKFPDEKSTNGWCYKDGDYNYVMVIHKDSLFSTLVHESNHITNMIFDFHGVRLDTKNDEHQTYFLTWIFEQCESFLKSQLPLK